MNNILYKIYYGNDLVYFGRTHQELVDRIRGHLFKVPGLKTIDIEMVSKIEFTQLNTEADMFIYEIYYINKYKPIFNKDDKACDEMSVKLPELIFKEWKTPLWEKWKEEIKVQKENHNKELNTQANINNLREKNEAMYNNGEIGESEFNKNMDTLKKQELELKLSKKEITFAEYCRELGLTKI